MVQIGTQSQIMTFPEMPPACCKTSTGMTLQPSVFSERRMVMTQHHCSAERQGCLSWWPISAVSKITGGITVSQKAISQWQGHTNTLWVTHRTKWPLSSNGSWTKWWPSVCHGRGPDVRQDGAARPTRGRALCQQVGCEVTANGDALTEGHGVKKACHWKRGGTFQQETMWGPARAELPGDIFGRDKDISHFF